MAALMDERVKDYLLFRGLNATVRTLEAELRQEKDKGFRVDKVLEQIHAYISNCDIVGLNEYWTYLDRHLFAHLDVGYAPCIRKLNTSILRIYLVLTVQAGRQEKVSEFYEKMIGQLQSQLDWRDWFMLPHIKNPEEHATFAMYFGKQWQDTVFLSLHNFLSVIIHTRPKPAILNFEQDQKTIVRLQESNERCQRQINELKQSNSVLSSGRRWRVSERNEEDREVNDPEQEVALAKQRLTYTREEEDQLQRDSVWDERDDAELPPIDQYSMPNSMELMDDFYSISQATVMMEKPKPKKEQIKSFFSNIALPSSPILGKKPNVVVVAGPGQNKGGGSTTPAAPSNLDVNTESTPALGPGLAAATGAALTDPGVQSRVAVVSTSVNTAEQCGAWERPSAVGAPVTSTPAVVNLVPARRPSAAVGAGSSVDEQPCVDASGKSGEMGDVVVSVASKDSPTELPNDPIQTTTKDATQPSSSRDSDPAYLLLSQEAYVEHSACIAQCCFSPSGQTVATLDVDGVLKAWSLQPSPVTLASTMSKSTLTTLEWANNTDKLLLLGSKVGSIRLFDIKDKKTLKEVTTDNTCPRIVALASHPQGTSFACSAAGRLRCSGPTADATTARVGKLSIWDLKTFKVERYLAFSPGPIAVNCMSYGHNGQLLLTGAADGVIRLYDVRAGGCVSQWAAHSGEVFTASFSSDDSSVYSLGSDGKFFRWSVNRQDTKLTDLSIHAGAGGPFITTGPTGQRLSLPPRGKLFALDSDGRHLLTCTPSGGLIYRIDSEAGLQPSLSLDGHRSAVICVDWSTSVHYKTCLTAAVDGVITVSTLLVQ